MVTTAMPVVLLFVRARAGFARQRAASVVANRSDDRPALVPGVAAQGAERQFAAVRTEAGRLPPLVQAGGGHAKSARLLELRPPV
jgi:hypothetical protein